MAILEIPVSCGSINPARDTTITAIPTNIKMFMIAAQDKRFWNKPKKSFFKDLPDASFIANLLNYKRNYRLDEGSKFDFHPATVNEAYQKNVLYFPTDYEGTQTRPYVYIRKRR